MKKHILLYIFVFFLPACSIWDKPKDPILTLDIKTNININPNVLGIPSPLEIRIYELSDSQAFNSSEFIQIYQDEQSVLKSELLLYRRLDSIFPGENRINTMPLSLTAKYVGVLAGFSQYQKSKNMVIYELKNNDGNSIELEIIVDGLNLSISKVEKD